MMTDDTLPPLRRPGHSFYGTLAPFPVACFILTLLSDLAYWATDSIIWETMSVWLLTIGLIVGGFAILAGLVDLARSRRIRGLAQPWPTLAGHVVAYGLSVVNVFVHSRDGYTAVVPQGLVLSLIVVLVLLVTALMGRTSSSRTHAEGWI